MRSLVEATQFRTSYAIACRDDDMRKGDLELNRQMLPTMLYYCNVCDSIVRRGLKMARKRYMQMERAV